MIEAVSWFPRISRVVRVNSAPASKTMLPVSKSPRRISGPRVSKRAATGRRSSSRRRFTRSSFFLCSSWVPWEKLKRQTFIPASIISRSIPSLSEEGPRVQMILVFRI